MEDDESFCVDSVSDSTADAQQCLDYLGYTVDRKDGYFSSETGNALKQYKEEHGLRVDEVLNKETYDSLRSAVILDWNTTHIHDVQLEKAKEILHG